MRWLYRLIMRRTAVELTEKQIRSGIYSHRNRHMVWNRPTVWLIATLAVVFTVFCFYAK